jgi:hypothetical protein
MARDPRVNLVFAHNLPRYIAIGVDPNDAQRLIARVERWEDWCRLWSEEAARHEALAEEARGKGRAVSAAEAYVRAAIYYHCGKHLFAGHAVEWRAAHDSVVPCHRRQALLNRSDCRQTALHPSCSNRLSLIDLSGCSFRTHLKGTTPSFPTRIDYRGFAGQPGAQFLEHQLRRVLDLPQCSSRTGFL